MQQIEAGYGCVVRSRWIGDLGDVELSHRAVSDRAGTLRLVLAGQSRRLLFPAWRFLCQSRQPAFFDNCRVERANQGLQAFPPSRFARAAPRTYHNCPTRGDWINPSIPLASSLPFRLERGNWHDFCTRDIVHADSRGRAEIQSKCMYTCIPALGKRVALGQNSVPGLIAACSCTALSLPEGRLK